MILIRKIKELAMNTDFKMLVDRWYYFLMFKPDYFNGHDEINQKVYT